MHKRVLCRLLSIADIALAIGKLLKDEDEEMWMRPRLKMKMEIKV